MFFVCFCSASIIHRDGSDGHWNCSRKWPYLELFLPIIVGPDKSNVHGFNSSLRNSEWMNIFMRSFMLFWPVNLSGTVINLIVDAEVKENISTAGLFEKHVTSFAKKMAKVCYVSWEYLTESSSHIYSIFINECSNEMSTFLGSKFRSIRI